MKRSKSGLLQLVCVCEAFVNRISPRPALVLVMLEVPLLLLNETQKRYVCPEYKKMYKNVVGRLSLSSLKLVKY